MAEALGTSLSPGVTEAQDASLLAGATETRGTNPSPGASEDCGAIPSSGESETCAPAVDLRDLAGALRRAAASALPEGAFLRRDRGDGLFVTDAPRLVGAEDCARRLEAVGFRAEGRGALLCLTPGPEWLTRLEALFPQAPDPLCASLLRFAGLPPEEASLRLFALGTKALDGGEASGFDRLLRQRAALCLRLNASQASPHGGGLYACALLRILPRHGEPGRRPS